MSRRRIVGLILAVLLVLGLVGIAGYAGWSQGFAMGLAAGGEGRALQAAPFAFGFAPFFIGLGFIFKFALFLLLFLFIARIFGFWFWRRGGGPRGRRWPGHHPYGPVPPWQ